MRFSRGSYVLWACMIVVVALTNAGCPGTATVPEISDFAINDDDAVASSRTVVLSSFTSGLPDEYIASESPSFAGASWYPYSDSVGFQLSAGNGLKTVYFQVRNSAGASGVVSDTITLNETEYTVLLPGNVPMTFVPVPGSTFQMGRSGGEQDSYLNEDPQHNVTVSGFWMAKYELTKRQWQALMGTTPWSGNGYVLNNLDSPAVFVSWNNAKAFVTALNNYTGLTFRLPTEAEWEFACRAGTTTRFYWGNDTSYTAITSYAWVAANANNYGNIVGQKTANSLGLYDMSGNVIEWCEDAWHDSYTGAPTNGSAWNANPTNTAKVARGGHWFSSGYECRSAYRNSYEPAHSGYQIGFRLAITGG